jgi:gamma-glutamylcyclotransferase (GGCT)/AIG2-like uncharacterized protein YtfP
MHLFTYGTLAFPQIWMRVVGREFPTQQATVAGYAAYRAKGELFPVIVPAGDEATVAGLVYFDVDDETVAALDEFESDLYERVDVDAVLEDGRPLRCGAYVLAEKHRSMASSEWWDAAWFEREAMGEYLRRIAR